MVTIELFGVPRLYAGRAEVQVEARTIGEALRALGRACPALCPAVVVEGALTAGYLIARDGGSFVADPNTMVTDGEVLVLVSAQAGG